MKKESKPSLKIAKSSKHKANPFKLTGRQRETHALVLKYPLATLRFYKDPGNTTWFRLMDGDNNPIRNIRKCLIIRAYHSGAYVKDSEGVYRAVPGENKIKRPRKAKIE